MLFENLNLLITQTKPTHIKALLQAHEAHPQNPTCKTAFISQRFLPAVVILFSFNANHQQQKIIQRLKSIKLTLPTVKRIEIEIYRCQH